MAVFLVPFGGVVVGEVDKAVADVALRLLPEPSRCLRERASAATAALAFEADVEDAVAAASTVASSAGVDAVAVAARQKRGIRVEFRLLSRLDRATSKP